MNSLVILVPVLRRPHRVRPLLDSIAAATPQPHRVLFLTSPGDQAEKDAIGAASGAMLTVDGNYARKINAGVRATSESFIFLGADDLHFHPGWLEAAKAKLTSCSIGVVGVQDLCSERVIRGEHATHCLVTRAYTTLGTIDDPSAVLHEGYPHEFVDDEFVATAKHRGAWVFANDAVVEHLHPMVGKAPMDDLYAGQRHRMRSGRRIFQRRQHLWSA